jgi:UDP-N-acetylmuramoylalanine--D-glutamate ligase
MISSFNPSPRLPQNIFVIGLGKVGLGITRFLLKNKIVTYAYDDNINRIHQYYLMPYMLDSNFILVHSRQEVLKHLAKTELVIVSPGIGMNHDLIKLFNKAQIPIMDEIDFVTQYIKKPIIAITGTNGKSTTTSLLGRIVLNSTRNCFWGGNLAPGLCFSWSLMQEPKDYYIIEVSSFQLARCRTFSPYIAILLNISHDHLNWHKSFTEYRNAKFNIFKNQSSQDFAIVNYDDRTIMNKVKEIKSNVYYFSTTQKVNGTFIKNNDIFFNNEKICDLSNIILPGEQYLGSILAAVCAAKILGIKNSVIKTTLRSFKGLPHRLEFVAEFNGIKYINNSMCTNPASAAATLKTFREPVILITGGKEKNLPLNIYIDAIKEKSKYVVLIGENRTRLYKILKANKYHNVCLADNLKTAVRKATQIAQYGDIVLFSPGFASFDMFLNFVERGEMYKKAVFKLIRSCI